MIIEFTPDAGDSYNRAIGEMPGYLVRVTTTVNAETEETEEFDAYLRGVDHDAGWYGTLLVERAEEDEHGVVTPCGTVTSVVADKIAVY